MKIVALILALTQLALRLADWANARRMFNEHEKEFFEGLIHRQAEALKLYEKHAADFQRGLPDERLREPDENVRLD